MWTRRRAVPMYAPIPDLPTGIWCFVQHLLSGFGAISHGNTTRSATSRGVHEERGDRKPWCVLPIPAVALARGWEIGHVVTAGEALSDAQSLTAISLCSACPISMKSDNNLLICSIAVGSFIRSRIFPEDSIYSRSKMNWFMISGWEFPTEWSASSWKYQRVHCLTLYGYL